ncbi:MAG: CU044_5270 family protein [Solirubrobacterales bacterium]
MIDFNPTDASVLEASVAAGRSELRALIELNPPSAARRARRRPGRVFGVAAALACAALLAGVVVGLTHESTPENVGALNAVADRVATQPDPAAMKPGDSYYTGTRFGATIWVSPKDLGSAKPGQKGWVQNERAFEETWITPGGKLVTKTTPAMIEKSYPTAEDRRNAMSADGGVVQGISIPLIDDTHPDRVFTVGDDHLDYAALQALPSGTAELAARLKSSVEVPSGNGETADMMRSATALLGYPVSSDVRAAIFRVMAGLDGVTVKQHVTDAAGRSGTSVSWLDAPYRKELVFNPNTGVDLELRSYNVQPRAFGRDSPLPAGTLEERYTYLSRGVVGRSGERPRAARGMIDAQARTPARSSSR